MFKKTRKCVRILLMLPKQAEFCQNICPKGLLCRGGSRKSCVSVRPVSVVRCPCPVSGPFSIRFQSSKMKIPVQFLRKRGPKRVPSATFGSKSEMDLGQRIIQILWRFARHKIRMRHLSFWWDFPSGDLAPQVSSSIFSRKVLFLIPCLSNRAPNGNAQRWVSKLFMHPKMPVESKISTSLNLETISEDYAKSTPNSQIL